MRIKKTPSGVSSIIRVRQPVFGHGRANAELKCDIADVSPGWVRVPPENETCRTRILATMEMLEFRHRREVFRLDEIIDHMVELGSPYTVATIRATIFRPCVWRHVLGTGLYMLISSG